VRGVMSRTEAALRIRAVPLLLLFVATLVSLPGSSATPATDLSLAASADASGWGSLRVYDRLQRARWASLHHGFATAQLGAGRWRGVRVGNPSAASRDERRALGLVSPSTHRAVSSSAGAPLSRPAALSTSAEDGGAQRGLVHSCDSAPPPSVGLLTSCRSRSAGGSREESATGRYGASAVALRAPPARAALVPPPIRA
jgi:hypothetical protein